MRSSSLFTLHPDPAGTKPALVLGNSLGAGIDMWSEQLAAWRKKFRIVRFDYPGHNGTRGNPDVTPSADVWAGELLSELAELGVDTFSYVGVSLGGMLGLRLAAAAPTRLERLVVANARYYQSDATREQWSVRINRVTDGYEEAMAQISAETISRWLSEEFRARNADASAGLQHTLASTAPEGYIAGATVVRDYDARSFLEAVKCPVLLIAGSEDVAAPADHMLELATLLRAHVEVLPGAAHLSNVDSADNFIRAVADFLAMPSRS